MPVHITKADNHERICPDCETCVQAADTDCGECGRDRPVDGWTPLHHAGRPYLGALIDERYLLDRFLGGGASGSVYRAHDRKLDRPFALKILRLGEQGADDEERLRRFDKEVEALSRIRNPHVVNIYESMRLDEQTPGMLTEYIAGATLRDMLGEDKHLDVQSALTLIHQIANGLHEAHAEGVVHRDLKPANVMVEKLPATGSFARILDFGLVHIAEDPEKTQGFWGTPLYAAPEQCGAEGEITATTDIYSLGCVLFRCVAGRPVFEKSSTRALMVAQYEEPAPSLARAAPQTVPSKLEALVDSMLAKDPADRPENMATVIETIDELSGDDRRWSESVVIDEAPEEPPGLRPDGGDSDRASSRQQPRTSSGTRIGVAGTDRPSPRLAQLLQRVDLSGAIGSAEERIPCASFDAGGDCVIVADAERRIHVMSTKGGDFFQTLAPAEVTLGAVVPDITSGRIFGAEQNGRLLRWRLEAPKAEPESLGQVGARVFALAVGSRGQKLYLGTESGDVLCRDLRLGTLDCVHRLENPVCDVQFSADGRHVVVATLDGEVIALDARGHESRGRERLGQVESQPVAVDLASGLERVVVADETDCLWLYSVPNGEESTTVEPSIDEIRELRVTGDQQIFALSVREPMVRVWRLRHEMVRQKFRQEPHHIR
jgi:serine/threonine protein kinase